MVVQHNLTAMNSNRMLGLTTAAQAKSTEKLSSGYKINRAADDAAGLSISEKMRRQIRGLTQAAMNAQDGISAVQTAEGALTEVHDMLQRMDELATKAANGTMSEDDRQAVQDEIDQLITEIDRVSATTKFNELDLLKGGVGEEKNYSYKTPEGNIALADSATLYTIENGEVKEVTDADLKDYADIQAALDSNKYFSSVKGSGEKTEGVQYTAVDGDLGAILKNDGGTIKYVDESAAKLYKANGDAITEAELGDYFVWAGAVQWKGSDNGGAGNVYTSVVGDTAAVQGDFKEAAADKLYDEKGNEIAEADLNGLFNEKGELTKKVYANATDGPADQNELTAAAAQAILLAEDVPAPLEFNLHVGSESDDENKIKVTIESMSAAGIGVDVLSKTGVMTEDDATNAIDTIKAAVSQVSKQRSALGAVQNRLEHTINNLNNVIENTTAAESQIRDTDMATEMVTYANNNILAQAGQAMLAQSNQANQGVLSLLG